MPLIIALTGGIGSGKTVASDHFGTLGVPVIDTDIIAREIVEPGQPTLVELCDAFGNDILDSSGKLNRDILRKIAFSNTENKQKLDSITHPAIRTETSRQIGIVEFTYCIVVIPLLTQDSPFIELADRVTVVLADKDIKIKRVMQRSNLSREETIAIMRSQISDEERLEFADDVIHNNSSIEDVHQLVEKLHLEYLRLSKT